MRHKSMGVNCEYVKGVMMCDECVMCVNYVTVFAYCDYIFVTNLS